MQTGHASFRSWCAACVQGRGRAERHQGEGHKELEDWSKVPVGSWDYCSLGARNRISGGGTVWRQSGPGDARWSDQVNFCSLNSRKTSRSPVVRRWWRLDTLGYHRVVFRCDNELHILALLEAVKLALTGDVVQETSAEGDPIQRCCRKFSECRHRACQINQTGGGVSFGCGGASGPCMIC